MEAISVVSTSTDKPGATGAQSGVDADGKRYIREFFQLGNPDSYGEWFELTGR